MQSQQEQQKASSKTTPYYDEYAWLSKLNLVALALFGLAFLYFEDEARGLCGIAVFFCFIFIFVLQALRHQHRKIYAQQLQIDYFLERQTALEQNILHGRVDVAQRAEQSVPISPYDKDQAVAMREAEHLENQFNVDDLAKSSASARGEHPQVKDNFTPYDPAESITRSTTSIAEPQTVDLTAPEIQADTIHQNTEHSVDAQDLAHTQDNASIEQAFASQTSQDNVLLKDLKNMTSLWRAFVDWFKGGNSIVRIAIIILLIGVILLLRFASEYWQPTLSTKMVGIAVAGTVMTVIGYRLRHMRYGYAISVQGAGLGILFLVLFSAFKLMVISSITMSYGLLIVLLAVTLLLALRQNALILAFIALGSGFIAPFILNTGSHNIPALFTYYLALNSALAVIAFFKPWRILNTVSLLATFGVGGLSIWTKAQPEQYMTLTLLIWLHFALYLFISIRYSLNISKYKIAFKKIPLIDTGLIFATPFMAFTLYAGLVYNNHRSLSLASAILAGVYLGIGYFLHKKYQSLTLLIQSFYGLGLTFLALVLPFAFNAQWTSTGWAVQALALIWIGCRHHLRNSLLFGLTLLVLSTGSWLKSLYFDGNANLLAVTFLSLALMFSLYIFFTPQLNEADPLTDLDENQPVSSHAFLSQLKTFIAQVKVVGFIALQGVIAVYSAQLYHLNQLNENMIFMVILTLSASVIAWRIYQVQREMSNAVQLFIGCALFYFAMIPVMLWQAGSISLWWTMQAFIMLIVTSYFGIQHLRNFASVILLASAFTSIVAIIETDTLRFGAVALLVGVFALSAYYLAYKVKYLSTENKQLNIAQSDQTFSGIHLVLSFLFVPYLAYKIFGLLNLSFKSIVLPMLIWWAVLTIIYRVKQPVFRKPWLFLTISLMLAGVVEIAVICTFATHDLRLWQISSQYYGSMLWTIVLWGVAFIFNLKQFATQLNHVLAQILMLIAVLLMAVFGGLIAWNELIYVPLLLLIPVVVLLASLKVSPMHFLQQYWVENLAIVILALLSLWAVSLSHDGGWNLAFVTLLNPIDLLSIGVFALLIFATKPFLLKQIREVQIAGVAVIILTGLMLISSIMLRSLHQYFKLPYWSVEA